MAELKQDIIIFKHRHHVIEFSVDGVQDLQGCTIYWGASETPGSAILVEKSSLETGEIEVVENVVVLVTIEDTDFNGVDAISDLEPAEPGGSVLNAYYHELLIVDVNNKSFQAAIGDLDLRNVTLGVPI
jgi:hypothetical protein